MSRILRFGRNTTISEAQRIELQRIAGNDVEIVIETFRGDDHAEELLNEHWDALWPAGLPVHIQHLAEARQAVRLAPVMAAVPRRHVPQGSPTTHFSRFEIIEHGTRRSAVDGELAGT